MTKHDAMTMESANYVHVGRWIKCAHCGTVNGSINGGLGNLHYCGAPWQQAASDVPADWIAALRALPSPGPARAEAERLAAEIADKAEKADAIVHAMTQGDGKWRMSIPANVERDYDIVISRLATLSRRAAALLRLSAPLAGPDDGKTETVEGTVMGVNVGSIPYHVVVLDWPVGTPVTVSKRVSLIEEGGKQ